MKQQSKNKSILNAGCSVQKCLLAVISGQHIYLKPNFFSVLGLFVGLIYAHGLLFLFLLPEKCWDFLLSCLLFYSFDVFCRKDTSFQYFSYR